jgi:xanthine dehydrogenase YagR molybdenum-binding subunit
MLYACDNISTTHKLVTVDTHQPTYMRAPGESTGVFALEVAMDELARKLNLDPVELRILNYAQKDPGKDKPFSSKSLNECYKQAAEKFGWADRAKRWPNKVNDQGMLVGYGMATATYPSQRQPSGATVQAYADGSIIVKVATQDLGTGTYTVMSIVVAQALGIEPSQVKSQLGDTIFPKSGISGGSMTTSGVGPAVADAVEKLKKDLVAAATADSASPLHGIAADKITFGKGNLISGDKNDPIKQIVARQKKNVMEAAGSSKPGSEKQEYSMHAFGAVFVEVNVDPKLGMVKVPRVVAAYAAGRIINEKTARSQFLGGLVFAHGMALLEETITDPRTGKIVNDDLSEYLVPVNADIHSVEVIQVPELDPHVNPLGTKGIGEIGIVGAPAAIVNAIFDATGKRVRDLPVTPEKLLWFADEKH